MEPVNSLKGKVIEITSFDFPQNWYADKVGQRFTVQSECSRDRNKLIVKTTIEQAGWPCGWVKKSHCRFVKEEGEIDGTSK